MFKFDRLRWALREIMLPIKKIISILACPERRGELHVENQLLGCTNCKIAYPYHDFISDFTTSMPYPSQAGETQLGTGRV